MSPDETTHIRELLDERDSQYRQLFTERDRQYDQRFAALYQVFQAAIQAQKDLTASAFAASREAILKAEQSQTAYNTVHNDLVRKMDSQYREMMPREQALEMLRGLEGKIAELRDSVGRSAGRSTGLNAGWVYLLGAVGLLSTLAGIIMVIVGIAAR